MKVKKEFIALAVVIVALLLYILFKSTDKTHYELPEFDKIEKSEISKLLISKPDNDITLERRDDGWIIQPQGYPADQTQVDRMLDAVSDFLLNTLVSESKNYSQYELADDKKIGLEVLGGDTVLRKFDIGKTASTYRHTFVRLEGDFKVYQARGNIRQPFDIELDRLRDKVVSKIDKDFVTAISMTGADGDLEIMKREEPPVPLPSTEADSMMVEPPPPWYTEDGKAADENVVNGIINALANLRCDNFIEGKSKEDFSDPIFSLSVKGVGSVTIEVFEKQEDNKYPAVSSQSDYPFLLSEWTVKRFMKKPEEILLKEEGEEAAE